jgi:hypothetical protein
LSGIKIPAAVTVLPPFAERHRLHLLYGNLPVQAVMAQWGKPKVSTRWVAVVIF